MYVSAPFLLRVKADTSQAAGELGIPVLNALINSGKFSVTVLVRSSSKATFPTSVKVIQIDYESLDSLTHALKGHDALVSTVGPSGFQGQTLLIDAAVAAGVKRFLPSEFGSDLDNPKVAALPFFDSKITVNRYVEAATKTHPDFTYTLIRNAAFLDWGIKKSLVLDWKSGKPTIWDGGDRLFSATTLTSVGQAVVGVLANPEATKNRAVYVQDLAISQNKLLSLTLKVAPQLQLEPVPAKLADIKAVSDARIAKGEFTMDVLVLYIFVSLFGEGYGRHWAKTDNELLGISGNYTDADIEAILKKSLPQ